MPDTDTTDTPPVTRPTARPTERELRRSLAEDVRRVDEIRPKLGTGKATGHEIAERRERAQRAKATHAELKVRRGEQSAEEGARWQLWKRGRRSYPLTLAREKEHPLLDGIALEHERLTDEEIAELRDLVRVRHRDEETPEQSARFEALIGKAAAEAGVLDRRRDEEGRGDACRGNETREGVPAGETRAGGGQRRASPVPVRVAHERRGRHVRRNGPRPARGPRLLVRERVRRTVRARSAAGCASCTGPRTRSACRQASTSRPSRGTDGPRSRSCGA